MNVQVHELSSYERKVDVVLPADRVESDFGHVLNELRRKAKVPGFRKGKVPRQVLMKRFRDHVQEGVIERLIEGSYADALAKQGLVPVSQPHIVPGDLSGGSSFSYTLTFEIMPKVEITGYEGLEVEAVDDGVSEEAVSEEIEARRERASQVRSVERQAAQEGDIVHFDYDGSVEGEPMEGGTRTGLVGRLGAEDLLPAFEEGLVGAEIGVPFSVDTTFPDDHPNQDVAGKTCSFSLTLRELEERLLPDLDDEFAKDQDFESLEEMRAKLREDLEEKKAAEAKREREDGVIRAILEQNDFDIPPAAVTARSDDNLRRTVQTFIAQGLDVRQLTDIEELRKDVRERTAFEIRKALIVDSVARARGLEITEADVQAKLEQLASETGTPVPKLKASYGQGEGRLQLEESLKAERVLEFLVSQANISIPSDKSVDDG